MAKQRYGPWYLLGLDPTHDERAVKRAYAAKLKAIDPSEDRQAFLDLRAAFEAARREAQRMQPPPEEAKPSLADPSLDFKLENLRSAPREKMLRNKPIEARDKIRVSAASKTEGEKPKKDRLRGKVAKAPELIETAPKKPRVTPKEEEYFKEEATPKTRVTPKTPATEFLEQGSEPKVRVTFGKADEDQGAEPIFHPTINSPWGEDSADGEPAEAYLSQLQSLVRRNKNKPVDERTIEAVFTKLMESPDLDNMGRREAIEQRVAEMALNAKERGHFLLLLADWNFGWYKRADDFDLRWPFNVIAELSPAIRKYRNLQGYGKSADRDREPFLWLQQPPPSRISPIYWWRRSSVLGFINRSRTEMPQLLNLIGRDNIAAWENSSFSGWRMVILTMVLLYGTISWATPMADIAPMSDATFLWAALGAFLVIGATVVYAEWAETKRLEDDPGHFYDPPDKRRFAALAALAVLILVCGLLPPSIWIAFASVPLTMALFYLTDISLLRSLDRERSFLYERRYTMGAFLVMLTLTTKINQLQFAAFIIPALFFCWAAARLHQPVQYWLDSQRTLKRWQLQLVIWLAAEACLLAWIFVVPGIDKTRPDAPLFLLSFAAMMVIVVHDLITPRDAEIPGTTFLILPILTAAAAAFNPIPVMMGVIILRCIMIFVAAWRSRKRAVENGRIWHDSGVGYNSGADFSNITFFGIGGRKEGEESSGISGWGIFWIIFIGFQLLRLLASFGG
jgi:hypothetical protein